MPNNTETIKEKADKIRLEILSCSDEDLVLFAHEVYCDTQWSVCELIEKIAADHIKKRPF